MRKVDAKIQSNKQSLKETVHQKPNHKLVKNCRYLIGSLKTILPTGKEGLGLFLALLMILQSNLYVFAAIKNSDETQKRAFLSEKLRRQAVSGDLTKTNVPPLENSKTNPFFNDLPNLPKNSDDLNRNSSQPSYFGADSKITAFPNKIKEFFSEKNKQLLNFVFPSNNAGKESFDNKLPQAEKNENVSTENVEPLLPPTTVSDAAISRRRPSLNGGTIDGSLRLFSGESFAVNSQFHLLGDLYTVGTPNITVNSGASHGGVINDGGSVSPSGYGITLNSGTVLPGKIHIRADAFALPSDIPTSVPNPSGTRYVNINSPSDVNNIGNWATLRSLNVSPSNLTINVPPGNYDTFSMNGSNIKLVFSAGTYNFSGTINLNNGSKVESNGQVTINIKQSLNVNNGSYLLGNNTSSSDVKLNVISSSMSVDNGSQINALVRAVNATVNLNNAVIRGQLIANYLNINNGQIIGAANAVDTTQPTLSITSPANNTTTQAATINLSGTASDTGNPSTGVASITVNGAAAAYNSGTGIWNFDNVNLTLGNNVITVQATDGAGNQTTQSLTVIRQNPPDTTPPTISIVSPTNNFTTFENQVTVSGTAIDTGTPATGVTSILVNGSAANYNSATGQWTANISLNAGINTITATATDNAAPPNQSQTQIQVTKLTTEVPALTITSPANGTFSSANSITVAGTVSSNNPNMALTVTVNGQAASITGGQFSQNITLNEGINTITVIARDALGQESQSSVTITRDNTPPTVSLNVPANVQPGSSYQLQAEAADSYGVAEVEFLVDGVSMTRTSVAPYQFNYLVPANFPPNQTISVSAVARDFSGSSAVATAQTVTTGPSGIVGFVFDDVTGYILPEAVAALNGQNSVLTEGTGRYSFVSPTNAGFVKVSKDGYTTVERSYNSEAGLGVEIFDSRLTPLDSKTNAMDANGGGTASSNNLRFSAQFGNGAFPSNTDVRLTEVSPQGLANLLPFGWSPVPGAVVDIRTAQPTIVTPFPTAATLTVSQVTNVTSSIPLTLARYDEAQHKWIVVAKDIVVAGGSLNASIPVAGQYAFLVADTGATAPPVPLVGEPLPSAASASSDALNGAVASANSSPRSAIYSQQAKSTITFEANSSSKLPSGVSIEATFDESYTLLLDRTTTFFGRPSQDFVLYSFPSANAETPNKLGAYFTAKPTRTDYGLADLLNAKIHVEIYTGRLAQSGVLIGNNGGTVNTDEGGQIEIPSGSTTGQQSVFFRRVAVNQTGISLPENYEIIAAFDFIQTGNDLTNSAKISFPSPSGDNSKIVVAKIINAGGQKLPKIIARAVEGDNSRIVSTIAAPVVPNNVNLEGVISSGRYVFVRVPHAFGYVSGTVVRSGVPNGGSNVRVTSNREPFGDITKTDAKFVLLGTADAVAGNTVSGAALGSDATGQSTVNLSNQDDAVSTNINLSTVPLQVEAVTPANNATNVIVTAPITLTFNKPISGTTITGSNFKLTTASGNPVIANLTALAGSRSVVLTPATILQGATAYRVTVTQSVKDIYGNPMSAVFQSDFTTANIITAQQRLKPQNIRVSYPNSEGISTISIPSGSVPEGSVVTVINRTSGSTVSTIVGTQAISLQIQAQVGDEIEIIIRQPDGVEYTIKQSAFRRDDGTYSVGANGGVVTSEDGTILLDIPAAAITGQANIKIYKALESEITAPRTGDMSPSEMAYAGGVKVEVSGNFTNKKELHLELDAPANLAEGQKVMFMSPKRVEFNGEEIDAWETVTSGKVENGKLKSNSPPFLGVTLVAVVVGLTLLSFFVFIPARLHVVRGRVQTANPNGVPVPIPDIYCAIHREGTNPVIMAKTNDTGDFAIANPSFNGAGTVTVIATKNGETKLAVATPYQSTEPSLFGFESRYALVEYSYDSPINHPANLQIEASTLNLPSGQIDPILSGRAVVGSQIKFKVKTTPSVESFTGVLNSNGVNATLAWSRVRQNGIDVYETTTTVSVPARYELSIESRTTNSNPATSASKKFGFIGVTSPANRPVLPGPPSVISVTPMDLAKQIDVGTKIHLEFSEPVRNLIPGTTIKVQERSASGELGANLSGTLSANDLPVGTNTEVSAVDFIPDGRLQGGKSYLVTVTSEVTDTDVNATSQPARNPLDQDAQTAGNQNFSSTFDTFQGVVISDTNLPYAGFRIAAVEDLLVATRPFSNNGFLEVYDTSSPQQLRLMGSSFISYYPIGLAVAKDRFRLYGSPNAVVEKIAVVTTAPVPFTDYNAGIPYAVQIYNLDIPGTPQLMGIVTLNQPRAASETPVNVSIHDKKAFVSLSSGGVAVINLEEAMQAFYLQIYASGRRNETEVGRIKLEAFRSGGTGYGRPALKQKAPYKTPSIAAAPVMNTSAMTQIISNQRQPIAYITSNQPQLISFNFDPSRNGILDFYDGNNDGSDDRVLVRKNLQPSGLLADVKAAPGLIIGAATKDLTVAVGGNHLWIFDTTNPANPTQYTSKTFSEMGLSGLDMARQVEIEGTLAYVRFDNKVAVIDFSNPESPYLSTVITGLGDNLRWFTVTDGFIYTLDSVQGIKASIGRGIAQVLAYGHDPTEADSICSSGVVIDRENRKPQQMVGFFIQVYGQQSPESVKVKIRKVTYSGNSQNEQVIKTVTGGTLSGTSQNVAVARAIWDTTPDNFTAEQDAVYTAEVILDEGKSNELHSKQVEIPFSFLIASNHDFGVTNPPATNPDAKQEGEFQYLLAGKSTNLKMIVDSQDEEIKKRDTSDDLTRPFGEQLDTAVLLTRKPDGRYVYKLRATLKANAAFTDEVEGFVTVGTENGDVRKPGSTVVNGVEIGSGNLALSANDLIIKGRGLNLEVARHYNSNSANKFNPFGYGWRHNYQVSLVKIANGESNVVYRLINSDGSIRDFNASLLQNGVIKVNAPNRGELVPRPDGSFDFFTPGRVKYHFAGALEYNSPRIYAGNLDYIEEPNGNRITPIYDSQGRMAQVKDSSDRALTYTYELADSPFAGTTPTDPNGTTCGNRNKLKELLRQIDQANIGKAWRITEINSSDGIKIEYSYDDKGNLERVQRFGVDTIGSESTSDSVWQYEYNPSPDGNIKYDHLVKIVKSPNDGLSSGGSTLNRRVTYEYDLTKPDIIPVTKIIMPEGVENLFTNTYRQSSGAITKIEKTVVKDGNGNSTTYNFDLNQRILSMVSPRSGTQTFVWTDHGQIRETVDAENVTTTQFYDENQNPTIKTISGGGETITTSTLYDKTFNKPLQIVDGNQNATNYRLDAKGNISRIDLPTGRAITINYYPNGDILDVTDEYGFVTRYTSYDAYGNPKTIQKEAGSQPIITNNTYDVRSRLKTTTDTLAPSVSYEYDAFDRVVSQTITDPTGFQDSKQITTAYLPEGQPTFVQQSGIGQNYRSDNVYDNQNRVRQIIETISDYGSITRNFSYDLNSNLITSQDRRGVTTTNTYDALNFLTKVEVSGGVGGTKTVWDASNSGDIDLVGNVKKFKDVYGNITNQQYDGIKRLIGRNVEGFSAETLEYDKNNNLLSQTDRNGHTTSFEYDAVNRQTKMTDAEGRQSIIEYRDADKKEVRRLVPQGLVETITFDAMKRPTLQEVKLATESSAYRTELTYSARSVRIKDPRGTTTVKELSAAGQDGNVSVEGAVPAFEAQTRYTAFGAVKSHTDANGRNFTFTVDGFNRTKSAAYDGEFSENWEFDGEGLLLSYTDKRGAVSTTSFDNLKRALETNIEKGGETIRVRKIEYLDSQSKEVITDANNHSTEQTYDGLRRVTMITNALGDSRTLTYDGENLTAETDWFNSQGKQTQYEYDKVNRPRKILHRQGAGGQSRLTEILYNDTGGLTKTTTDRRGNRQKEVSDGLGRMKSVYVSPTLGAEATERVAEFVYDGNSNRTAMTDGLGNTTNYAYDKLNRVQFVNHPGNLRVETYTYEANGNVATYNDGRGGSESYQYDSLDRLKSSTDGANNETKLKYDGEGLLLEKTEPKGGGYRTSYSYNTVGSLKSVTDADGKTWNLTYDAAQNLDTVTDPLQRTVDYDYDSLNRLTRVTQPLGLVTNYNEYDKNSNLKRMTDPKGQVVDYTYDELDRVKTAGYKNSQVGGAQLSFEYNYDAEDNLTEVKETNSINQIKNYSRKYDARNRLTEEKDSRQNIVNFVYDAASNVKQITARNYYNATQTTKETNYTYDALNRLDTVSAGSAQVAKYNWTADGLLDEVVYQGNASTKRKFDYDNADRVTNITNTIGTNTESFDYGYDANSNRTSETRKSNGTTTRTITYGFDALDRLSNSSYIAPPADRTPPPINSSRQIFEYKRTFAYEYDAVGNRNKETTQDTTATITLTTNEQGTTSETRSDAPATAEVTTAEFDDINRLTRTTKGATVKTFDYDNNGNLTAEKIGGSTVRSYEYDNRDQLTKIKGAASEEIARYDYDFERRRSTKFIQGAEIDYSYAGSSVVAEYNGNSLFNSYTLGANEIVKAELGNEGERYYYSDALGSTTSLASGSTLTARTEYGSFGEIIGSSGATYNSIGFTGQRLDSESGLMALGNGERYYSPELGRFIQQDSWTGMVSMAQSLNRYAYAYNNPFRFTDPSGNIADDNRGSIAKSAREYGLNKNGETDGWGIAKNTLARTGYDLWDLVSFGSLSREEENMAAWENGEITSEEARWNTFKNAAHAGAQVALMAATGGVGSALAAGAGLGTRIAIGAGFGLAEQFGRDRIEMAFGYRNEHSSTGNYALSAFTGGLFGALSPGKAATTLAKEGRLTLGTELRLLGQETKELAQTTGRIAKAFGEGFIQPLPRTMNGYVDPIISPTVYQAGARTVNGVKNVAITLKDTSVKPFEHGTYKDLKSRWRKNQQGEEGFRKGEDGYLEMDHQPSKAALIKAEEKNLGRKLTDVEVQTIINEGTAVAVPYRVHSQGPTFRGRNTKQLVNSDAQNLSNAAKRDAESMVANAPGNFKKVAREAADWIKSQWEE